MRISGPLGGKKVLSEGSVGTPQPPGSENGLQEYRALGLARTIGFKASAAARANHTPV
jgi:hypothetical protein